MNLLMVWCCGDLRVALARLGIEVTYTTSAAPTTRSVSLRPSTICAVDTVVLCPFTDLPCQGNQCCPRADRTDFNYTFPCPSAEPSFFGCESPDKVEDCYKPTYNSRNTTAQPVRLSSSRTQRTTTTDLPHQVSVSQSVTRTLTTSASPGTTISSIDADLPQTTPSLTSSSARRHVLAALQIPLAGMIYITGASA